MIFKVATAKTSNTKCHKCRKNLKDKKYLRIEDIGMNSYGGVVHVSLCRTCANKIVMSLKKKVLTCTR